MMVPSLYLTMLRPLAKTEHSHPLGMVVSTHFRCGKGVKRGLKNGALPFNIDKNAPKRLKKRSIAVHQLRRCVTDHLNSTKNGACPFTRKNRSRCHQDACDRKTEHVRSLFPLNVNPHQKNGACPFTSLLFLRYCMWKNQHTTRDHGRKDKGHEPG